jgi:hypothetical protein
MADGDLELEEGKEESEVLLLLFKAVVVTLELPLVVGRFSIASFAFVAFET